MGLFDQIAGMAGGLMGQGAPGGQPAEGEAPSGQPGGGAGLGGLGALGGAGAGGIAGAIFQMVQSQGGVGAILSKFHAQGMGDQAASWQGEGANAPVSPDQVQGVLGSGPIADIAGKLGIDPQQASGLVAQYLPHVMDHLTPGGQPAEGAGMAGMLGGLMSRFGGGEAPR